MRKLPVMILLFLLVCLPVSANPVTISGIGEVDLGQNVTITESHDKKGAINYNFKVKDGDIWRGACLLASQTIPDNNNIGTTFKLNAILDKMIDEKFINDTGFVAADKAILLHLGNKEAASVSIKITAPNFSIIISMNMILVSTSDGIKMFMFMCADSDTPYWKPIFHKILSNIQ